MTMRAISGVRSDEAASFRDLCRYIRTRRANSTGTEQIQADCPPQIFRTDEEMAGYSCGSPGSHPRQLFSDGGADGQRPDWLTQP